MVAGMEPTRINAHLTLREYRGGIRYGTDALLLASFVRGGRRARCADLGTGCGVIPLLLLASGRCGEARGFEVQAEYAALAAENARDNGLDGRFAVVQGDIRGIGRLCPAGWADYVTANPPYLRADCGGRNADFVKYAAFHEHFGDIDDFARAAAYLLGTGGVFYTVYRPDRLARLLTALSAAGLEPKRLRPVAADAGRAPSLVLVESVRGAAEGMVYEKNLVLYRDPAHTQYTEELERIYHAFS